MLCRAAYVAVLERDHVLREQLSAAISSALTKIYLPHKIHCDIGCLDQGLQCVFGGGYYKGAVDIVVVGNLWGFGASQQVFLERLRAHGFAGRVVAASGAPQRLRGVNITSVLGVYSVQSFCFADEVLRLPNQFDRPGEYDLFVAAQRVIFNLFCNREIG